MNNEVANENIVLETEHLRYVISNKGEVLEFTDKRTNQDYIDRSKSSLHSFTWLKKAPSLPPVKPACVLKDSKYLYVYLKTSIWKYLKLKSN